MRRYAGPRLLMAVATLAFVSGCSSGSRPPADSSQPAAAARVPTARNANGNGVIARSEDSPIAIDVIPACFVQGEPQAATGSERTDVYQPPPRPAKGASPTATPTQRPTPEVARIAAQASFPLYVINAPLAEFVPVLLRVTTVGAGTARAISLFAVQYRIPPQRGGGLAIVLSSPSQAAMPLRDDIDDAIDAIRLNARLPGTPRAGEPLADPGTALLALGCPHHEPLKVTVDGVAHPADLLSWPGLPSVRLLRVETGTAQVTVEAGLLGREALIAVAERLVALQSSPQMAALLQAVFGALTPSANSAPQATPVRRPASPIPRRATPPVR